MRTRTRGAAMEGENKSGWLSEEEEEERPLERSRRRILATMREENEWRKWQPLKRTWDGGRRRN